MYEMKRNNESVRRIAVVDYNVIRRRLQHEMERPRPHRSILPRGSNEALQAEKRRQHRLRRKLSQCEALEAKAREQPVLYRCYLDAPEFVTDPDMFPSLGDCRCAVFKDYLYLLTGPYTSVEFTLLVLEQFDRERKRFERLRSIHEDREGSTQETARKRIPEKVRIKVWRRDGGKCARCGERQRLEYDHIVPVAKGGGNTERNVELLCEKCNRSKGSRIQ
jgi:hypothetical protein